ncbi:MAG: metallophosphoesterase [Armatimonadetes bacterium]|nr:metallophosphoesterase [Armatimonadota bacterium]
MLRACYGVYGVYGNHDHWSGDIAGVIAGLRPSGMTLLVNQAVKIKANDYEWWLCGRDDSWAGRPDLPKTLADMPEGAFKILLCHEPDFADTAAKYDIGLQLSGHSHGGQVSLPLTGPIILPPHGRKYPVGLQQVGDTGSWVYTSRGIGVSFPPVRLNCRPEITLLTLSRA